MARVVSDKTMAEVSRAVRAGAAHAAGVRLVRRLGGFNERFRFYRYGLREYVKWYREGACIRSPDEASFPTFLIYLNHDFEGGATVLRSTVIQARAGSALFFPAS
jgi:hypothetical protein